MQQASADRFNCLKKPHIYSSDFIIFNGDSLILPLVEKNNNV